MKSPANLASNGRSRPASARSTAVRVDARFSATPRQVFNAWLDPHVAARWLFARAGRPIAHAEIDARVAGLFRFVERREGNRVEHTGEYVEIVPPRRLVFSLALDNRPRSFTRVSVDIEPRETGCKLSLTHEDLPADRVHDMEARWTGFLYGLGVTLDPSAADSTAKRRHIAPDAVLRHLALDNGTGRRNSQPSTRSE
jgi:uncharacterized protein YndB with AHSA1/START domain